MAYRIASSHSVWPRITSILVLTALLLVGSAAPSPALAATINVVGPAIVGIASFILLFTVRSTVRKYAITTCCLTIRQ